METHTHEISLPAFVFFKDFFLQMSASISVQQEKKIFSQPSFYLHFGMLSIVIGKSYIYCFPWKYILRLMFNEKRQNFDVKVANN